jgi:hypothetical protein
MLSSLVVDSCSPAQSSDPDAVSFASTSSTSSSPTGAAPAHTLFGFIPRLADVEERPPESTML